MTEKFLEMHLEMSVPELIQQIQRDLEGITFLVEAHATDARLSTTIRAISEHGHRFTTELEGRIKKAEQMARFDPFQVALGRGRQDRPVVNQALDVARQLAASGRWSGTGRLIIHHADQLHQRLVQSGQPVVHWPTRVAIYPGIEALVEGEAFEVKPLPPDFWQLHRAISDWLDPKADPAARSGPDPEPPTTDLSGAELGGVYLSGATLSGANLFGVNLSGAELEGANLSQATLRGANLSQANLGRANLPEADLRGAYLLEVNLSQAILSQAILSQAILSGADLSEAILNGADLREAELREADLSEANLSGADLFEADLSGADLSGADLSEANLSGANLSGANLSGADLSGANLSEAYLDEANLRGANLFGTDLRNAVLTGANLSGVQYNHQTIWPEGFDPDSAGGQLWVE